MRRRLVAMLAAMALVVALPGAAMAGPGKDIKAACGGASFGQLVSAGKSSGEAVHGNYKGGAKAFSDPVVLAVHGCTP